MVGAPKVVCAAAESGDGKFALDMHAMARTCRATAVESRLWAAIADARHGDARKTILMCAAARGDCLSIRWLTKLGASLEVGDGSGRTALAYAVIAQRRDAVAALLVGGARASATDVEGRSLCGSCAHELRAVRRLTLPLPLALSSQSRAATTTSPVLCSRPAPT